MMDPDECLRQLRRATKEVLSLPDARDTEYTAVRVHRADELAALFQSLDQWLSSGGGPPRAWRVKIYSSPEGASPKYPDDPVAG